jgi:CRP-like cAMP-binding protein
MFRQVGCLQCLISSKCPMNKLTTNERQWLLETKHAWTLPRGQLIYPEAVTADGIFLLSSGSVKLVTSGRLAQTRISTIVRPGEWFGLDAIIPRSMRMFAAIAREESVVCFVEKARLVALLRSKNEFSWHLIEKLSIALQDTQRSVVLFSGESVRKRLLNTINECNSRSISLKQVEVAAILGVSAETISREFRKLEKRQRLSA